MNHGYESLIGYNGRNNSRPALPSIGQVTPQQLADAQMTVAAYGQGAANCWPTWPACGVAPEADCRPTVCAPRCLNEFLGFEPTWLCPDDCIVLRTCPVPVPFTINLFQVAPIVAPFIAFSSIKIGTRDFVLCGEIPGAAFSTDNQCCCPIGGLQLPPGVSASITVTNTSNQKLKFRGWFCGSAIECA